MKYRCQICKKLFDDKIQLIPTEIVCRNNIRIKIQKIDVTMLEKENNLVCRECIYKGIKDCYIT
jgi:DNA-directed RNA polymerase subunit RPC12/RpoP